MPGSTAFRHCLEANDDEDDLLVLSPRQPRSLLCEFSRNQTAAVPRGLERVHGAACVSSVLAAGVFGKSVRGSPDVPIVGRKQEKELAQKDSDLQASQTIIGACIGVPNSNLGMRVTTVKRDCGAIGRDTCGLTFSDSGSDSSLSSSSAGSDGIEFLNANAIFEVKLELASSSSCDGLSLASDSGSEGFMRATAILEKRLDSAELSLGSPVISANSLIPDCDSVGYRPVFAAFSAKTSWADFEFEDRHDGDDSPGSSSSLIPLDELGFAELPRPPELETSDYTDMCGLDDLWAMLLNLDSEIDSLTEGVRLLRKQHAVKVLRGTLSVNNIGWKKVRLSLWLDGFAMTRLWMLDTFDQLLLDETGVSDMFQEGCTCQGGWLARGWRCSCFTGRGM